MTTQNEATTYVAFYTMEGSSDLPVWVIATSYAQAEEMFTAWRDHRNEVADRLLSRVPVRIERDHPVYP